MKKILVDAFLFLSIASITFIGFAWNPFSSSDWKSVGNAIADTAKDVGNKVADTATDVGNKVNDKVIKPLVAGWEKKREVGRLLDAGAKQLEDAPQLLQDQAVTGLQTGLIDGIRKSLMLTLIAKTGDIAAKRAEIAKFTKLVQDNKDIAAEIGKASVAADLLDGFNAADQALAMLWDGADLQKVIAPTTVSANTTAFGALRQKLATTAQLTAENAPDTIKKAIGDNSNGSILWSLLNAGQSVIDGAQNGINDIKKQIEELKGKIYPSSGMSLPKRMRGLADILKV